MARGDLLNKGSRGLRNRHIFLVKAAAIMRSKGEPYDYKRLGKIYDSSDKDPEAKARKIMSKRRITLMIAVELAEILKNEGVTPELVIKEQSNLLASCKDDEGNYNKMDKVIAERIIDKRIKMTGFYENSGSNVPADETSFILMQDEAEKGALPEKGSG